MKNIQTAIIVIFAFGFLYACETETAEVEQAVKTVNVETQKVEPEIFESYLQQVGMVTTNRDVRVSSEVSGRIVNLNKEEGEQVQEGETVIKVDDRKLQQELNRLQATTSQSKENYERLKRLYEEQDIGSEIDYLNAKYAYEQNLAALESIRVDLENTSISAPFTGILETVLTEVGEMVSPGTPVFRLISRQSKKVELGVPARFAGSVDLGDMAEVWFDYDTETRYQLPVTFIGNTIDPMNRTFTVEIDLPAELNQVKIDMIANVRLRTERIEDAIVVGEEYVFQKGGNNVVYVSSQDEQGNPIAVERVVSLGSAYGNNIVIRNGLATGDELVTVGASYLQDGSRIVNVEDEQSQMVAEQESE
ncbi:efflux RND transporter periplasmic adaptor subunit [Rhodohalobacter sulfatireducens]|uniref:Efflux RND transporter periplasmic adaptor subunit n=1 Tax=Rhodohalobacter sulfatireducens TaxID=2911366 RepID=A0ABS9KA55_9BACT|nr:efflux RND transporter periplasmic adaptor subunit [Rhodohalobacter sulfatireducens]MCG2587692.1 efflux RND transporter periplasmic adaptor subunit [Rhodohalobacter sulfatireducens]MDR9365527.1 efflux RND transporter periplasmic adaptor subunit [Balneolaceae bacterium]MDR9407671.1 efflux RND transporter periplasmic adaptor subunit [Balneolaceae bacterium]